MTTNSQLSTTEPKKKKHKLSKPLEQEENHRNGDHIEGYQWAGGGGRKGEKQQCGRGMSIGCLSHAPYQGPSPQPTHLP